MEYNFWDSTLVQLINKIPTSYRSRRNNVRHRTLPRHPVHRLMNSVYSFAPCFLNILHNIIFSSIRASPTCPLRICVVKLCDVHFPSPPSLLHVPRPEWAVSGVASKLRTRHFAVAAFHYTKSNSQKLILNFQRIIKVNICETECSLPYGQNRVCLYV
jgi:hypothetical protein